MGAFHTIVCIQLLRVAHITSSRCLFMRNPYVVLKEQYLRRMLGSLGKPGHLGFTCSQAFELGVSGLQF